MFFATALNEAKVEIRIQYKDVTAGIFEDVARNELVIRIQPSEAIYMKFNTKTPGLITRAIPTELDLTYKSRFSEAKIPEAYESLILDAFKGDHSNFVRDDELDVAWKVSADGLGQKSKLRTDEPVAPDLHPDLALDRRQRRRGSQARGVPLRISRTQADRRVYGQVRVQAVERWIVSGLLREAKLWQWC